ncbi:MAG TPA: condensation domain-containing protein, partial [Pyrinomonadaceae bacterium]|nr:condensation domain-containing protein [Pyrinomonadaceae bacterium]
LEDARVAVLLTQSQLAESLPPGVAAQVISLDREWDDTKRAVDAHASEDAASDPRRNAAPDALAYLIYTSGTTGRPKAVMVEHRQLTHTLLSARRHFSFSASDVMPVLASYAFDIWLFETLSPLLAGGTSLLMRHEEVLDVARLVGEMRRCGATLLHAVPSLMRQVVGHLRAEGEGAVLPLRMVFVGGDAVGADLLQEMRGVFPDSELRVLYGPTETAIICTAHAVKKDADSLQSSTRQLIGRPLAGVRIRILDAHRQVVPVGVAGEIHIGGEGVSRGYLNRDELTAEKFVELDGERYYRSGDVGRWVLVSDGGGQSDGVGDAEVEFLGRVDEQVKVRGFRVELGEIEAVVSSHARVRESAVVAREGGNGEKRLVAYIVARSVEDAGATGGDRAAREAGDEAASDDAGEWARLVEELRRHVRERLPEYMTPAQWVEMGELPLTAHGKVDKRRLPEAVDARQSLRPFVAPRTEIEATLADIWAKVLRVERVGANDNFFELGGDSILSIQTVARAREAGLHLTPKKLFQHQTVAELAEAIADGGREGVESEQGIVTGEVALVPVQHRFLEEGRRNANHFNMSVMLESDEALNPSRMRRVVEKLLEHHDALRLRLVEEDGQPRQFIAAPDERPPFSYFDLSHLPEEERAEAIESEASRMQRSLSLAEGPLARVALFHVGARRPDRLLIIVHHFAIDGVSWRILLEDLQTAYAQLERGEEIKLPPKTTSFKRWAAALSEYAKYEAVSSELPFWTDERRVSVRTLPLDVPGGANTESSARTVTVALEAEETRALLKDVPAAYRTQIGDVLLTALAQAFARWTGDDALLVEMEGHGRESIGDDVDVSRTVGWFTSVYPVLVVLGAARDEGAALKSVKEQLRKILKGGIGYGLLRYAGGDGEAAERLGSLPTPEVMFGYHGQFDQLFGDGASALRPASESNGPPRDASGLRAHLISISSLVAGGRMRFDWTYSENLHRRATIEKLAAEFLRSLRALVAHCLSEGAGGFTPSDFPLARIDQSRLDKLAASGRAVEDIYRLSPMQQGLLFHTLNDPASGLYILQVSCTLGGGFNAEAFKTAWRRVIERNTTLRTAIVWKGYDEPLQVVYRAVELPWREEDWRGVAADEQQRRLASALDEDLRQGFELSRAPLMRLALRRLADDAFHLVWSFHHILLDGWSLALLLGQVFEAYAAALAGEERAPRASRPYRDYIEWLESQDLAKAEGFWRRELEGFTAPTPLDFGARDERTPNAARERFEKRELKLSSATTRRLQALAQQHQLTLNTVVQGAWALLLSHYGDRDDIVFGAVVSGRPAELPNVETMLGIFINALPLRARPEAQLALVPWLKSLQERNVELRQYEYSPLVEVQRWSEVPKGVPLFESVFVFENYPLDESLPELGGALGIRDAHFESQNNYPLTVHAHPRGAELVLQFIYQTGRFDAAPMERVLGELASLLARVAERPEAGLGELKQTIAGDGKGAAFMEKATRARASFKQFKSVKPKAVQLGGASLVRTSAIREGEELPLVVEPNVEGLDAAAWARANLSFVNEQLLRHGAILFRGFGLRTAERFEQFVATITPDLFIENGEHPRRSISGSVYTPVAYPPDKQLLWHNENSFNQRWPTKIWFGCARPADTGGETPLADSRRVFQRLDPGIRRRFIEKQVMYVRNYEEGLGLNWQTVLRTSDKAEAEEICRRNSMEFEWKERDRLRTRSVRPAVVRHPRTGEWVWFNQAQHWHVSCLDPAAREFVESNFREEDYPRNCYYGDGTQIEDSVMQEILEVYRQLEVIFPWQQGDAVVLDNLLTAHGRNAYAGERSLFVAMGEMSSYDEVETEAGAVESEQTKGDAARA